MEEDNKNDLLNIPPPEGRATWTVEYMPDSQVGNMNDQLKDSRAKIQRTTSTTSGLPNTVNNEGIVMAFKNHSGDDGYQLFIDKYGKIATRNKRGSTGNWTTQATLEDLDRRINQITPNGSFMSWDSLPINDANTFTPAQSGTKKVAGSCSNMDGISGNKWGTILWMLENTNGNEGVQIYTQVDPAKIWTRRHHRNQWSPWVEIATGNNILRTTDNNTNERINNANLFCDKTGVALTSFNCDNLPDLGGTGKSGIIHFFMEDNQSNQKKGVQVFYPIEGSNAGLPFYRVHKGNDANTNWTNWISNKDQTTPPPTNESFKHHNETIPHNDIKQIEHSGYYHTTPTTEGLPTYLDKESKNGILKILKQNNKTMFEYTPTNGNYKSYIFNGELNTTTKSNTIDWWKVSGSEGHTKIFDTRDEQAQLPPKYQEHSGNVGYGFVMYEWKWANRDNLPEGQRAVVQTFTPASREIDGGQRDIFQIAYIENSGHQYYRATTNNGQQWGNWQPITGGGVQPPATIDKSKFKELFKECMKEMFDEWKQKHTII